MTYEPRKGMYQGAYLPHTEAGGKPQMITFRLDDSIPRDVLDEKIDLASSQTEKRLIQQRYLDQGLGRCILAQPRIGEMVAGAIKFYDDKNYQLVDWVVMPNHVHFVYKKPQASMAKVVGCIKSYTTNQINDILGESGRQWQRDYYDRFARKAEHLTNMSNYTLLNPVRAGLVEDPFDWPLSSIHDYSKELKIELERWYERWKDRFWRAVVW